MSSDMVHSEGWKMKRLGEIANLNYGKGLRSDKREPGSVPVYSSAGVTGYHNVPLVNEPGIIVGRKGSVGTVYLSEEPFYCIDTAYYIKKSEVKCDFKFLYYLLQTLGLENMNQDSAVPGLNRDHAHSLTTFVPDDVTEQKRIATILSTLDEKIELNHKTNQTLEEIAQAIFKEWFIDFNYPGATGEMVDSKMGLLPKGWRIQNLGELSSTITKGTTPTTLGDNFVEKGVRFLRVDCIDETYGIDESKSLFITQETHEKLRRSQLMQNDILITIAGSIGRLSIVSERVLPANLNQAIGIIRIDENIVPVNYIFQYLKQPIIRNKLLSGVTQSVQANISLQDLRSLLIIIPSKQILLSYKIILGVIQGYIDNNNNQSTSLQKIRDLLLSKFMRGDSKL